MHVPLNKRSSGEIRAAVRAWVDDDLVLEVRNFVADTGPRQLHAKWVPIAIAEATARGIPLNLAF